MTISLDRVGTPVPAVRPSTSPAASPSAPVHAAGTGKPEKRPFVSGFCGGGPTCKDTGSRCKGMFENGVEAKTKTVFCSCACHADQAAL